MIQNNILLKNFTTFGVGGKAKYFSCIRSLEELKEVFIFSKKKKIPFFILGNGSNVLFDDRGFCGIVIKNEMKELKIDKEHFSAGSGLLLKEIVMKSMEKGFYGLQEFIGIPASLGGAVFMNAGAFGKEISEVLDYVDFMTDIGKVERFFRKDIEFSYRSSSFKKKMGMITSVSFILKKGKLKEIGGFKRENQPLGKSAGSIFKNPKGGFAGKLIEECGFLGKKIGGARISKIHGNFIINEDKASSKDILALIFLVKKEVKKKYGIVLEEEICFLPYER